MEVLCITATKNRHKHLEKLVRCFVDQDYTGLHTLLIYNNSPDKQAIAPILTKQLPSNKKILLINNHLSLKDRRPYSTLGAVYNDILSFVDDYITTGELNPDLVNHMDDDDIFLPNHISEGVKGYIKGGRASYKPSKSYYANGVNVHLVSNTLEPSVFVNWEFLKKHGYYEENKSAHLKWIESLIREGGSFVDTEGLPTFIYDWSSQIPVTKLSAVQENKSMLQEQSVKEKDIGDGIITAMPKEQYQEYLNKIKYASANRMVNGSQASVRA